MIRNNCISFRGQVVVDIGASTPAGSCKIVECDDEGHILNKIKTTVNNQKSTFFDSKESFVESVAERIAVFYKNIDGKGLSELTILLPGSTYGEECLRTPNLKDKDSYGLTDIDFSKMKTLLVQKGIKINEQLKPKILQDSMGIGLSVFNKMMINDLSSQDVGKRMLLPGKNYTVIMTGGGCGIAQINCLGLENGQYATITGAGSNYLSDADKSVRVSDIGASVKATLGEFCNRLSFNEKISGEVIDAGFGELILNDNFMLKRGSNSEKLMHALSQTGKYDIKQKGDEIYFQVKPEALKMFDKARVKTIGKYARAIARFLPGKLAEGINGLILTGPFAFAIDDCLREKYDSSISETIMDEFTPFNSDEYKSVMDHYGFSIICDKAKFAVSDNTDCSEVLNFAKFFGERRNSTSINITKYGEYLLEKAAQVAKKL